VHPKVESERLGHATIGVTLDLYSHVTRSIARDAADVVASRILSDRPSGALSVDEWLLAYPLLQRHADEDPSPAVPAIDFFDRRRSR
jgi:hypothetical protein